MHVTKLSETSVSITNCVVSYPHLHEPRSPNPTDEPKFSGTFILPATMDAADWDILNTMVDHVAAQRWPNGRPASFRSPFKNAGEKTAEYDGHYAISATAKKDSPPAVVKEDPNLRAEPGEVYAGCGVNVYLGTFAYQHMGNTGVGFGLNGVQICDRTLQRIDGRKAANQVFGQVAVQAPTTVPGAAGMPAPVSPTPHQPSPAPAPSAPVAEPAPAPVAQPAAAGPAPAAGPVPPGAPGPAQ